MVPHEHTHGARSFYKHHHDRIDEKRHRSPYWLRRWAHERIYDRFLDRIDAGATVLDAGCGEGGLSILMAQRGAQVTGVDLSKPNVGVARHRAVESAVVARFVVADLTQLPFADDAFDIVLSSHVIEHLPDPTAALLELRRVAKDRVLIAMPTCLNPAAWVLLGGGTYWRLSKRAPVAWLIGLLRTLAALIRGTEGPQEGYAGRKELPHIWRFPWAMIRMIEQAGLEVEDIEAGPLVVPYLAQYFPPLRSFQRGLNGLGRLPLIRYLGYGTHAVARPKRIPPGPSDP